MEVKVEVRFTEGRNEMLSILTVITITITIAMLPHPLLPSIS